MAALAGFQARLPPWCADEWFRAWLNAIPDDSGTGVDRDGGDPDLEFSDVSLTSATAMPGDTAEVVFTIRSPCDRLIPSYPHPGILVAGR